MDGNWTALLPFVVVLVVAIWTKQVLPGLTVGLLAGAYLKNPSIIGGIEQTLAYVVDGLTQKNNLLIIMFLYLFTGLVEVMKMAGGIKGFVEFASERIHTKTGAMLLAWLSTFGTFSAPTFRIVTVAPIMRAFMQRVKISAEELGFVVETTAAPVIALIPIATAFVGYMTSVIQLAIQTQGIEQDAYTLFIQSIPFNFFSIVMILLGIYLSFFHHSNDKEKVPGGDKPDLQEEDWRDCHPSVAKELPAKPMNLLLPLFLMVGFTLFLTWWDGRQQGDGLFQAFIQADVLQAMVVALLITTLVSIFLFLFQGMRLKAAMDHFVTGGNEMMSVILLLAVVWGLSAVAEDLGFSAFITAHAAWIPPSFILPVLFLFGAAISYVVGSSWGTWGILMPLGVSLAQASGTSLPTVIGAVFASGSFGSFASPLSNNTVTIAEILKLPVLPYSRYKLIPALIAAGIATVLYAGVTFVF